MCHDRLRFSLRSVDLYQITPSNSVLRGARTLDRIREVPLSDRAFVSSCSLSSLFFYEGFCFFSSTRVLFLDVFLFYVFFYEGLRFSMFSHVLSLLRGARRLRQTQHLTTEEFLPLLADRVVVLKAVRGLTLVRVVLLKKKS